jgi:hypothetical protein
VPKSRNEIEDIKLTVSIALYRYAGILEKMDRIMTQESTIKSVKGLFAAIANNKIGSSVNIFTRGSNL